MLITLFHLKNSRSQRILWLLEELNLNYEIKICHDHQDDEAYKELKKFHSLVKFPTLLFQESENTKRFTIAETSAISDFLCQQTQQLNTQNFNLEESLDFYYWKNFAEASFIPSLALKQIFTQIVKRTPFPVRFMPQLLKYGFDHGYLNANLDQYMQMLDTHLENKLWVSGSEFSNADILLWFPTSACYLSNSNFQRLSNISRYLAQIESRPAFQTALQKGQWSASDFKTYWTTAW
ncbi:glutathione S-transferase N-terminal domain-containing protein [Acinetobacter sp. ANC 3832]|uniref:glutathione S-transferase N-terminal domain-containing protein n=1 Tax=Acinetobacter sp. ANC 3832 TaxID=1977874 RepID=UPI000A33AF61|nr:glutathione S-transferase N-terminal domain-containing protein [Acinetobacter sp. ANC 3832]OTG91152.1 glutathione S-transferase [Acinetobacter sp. ANC 3832]